MGTWGVSAFQNDGAMDWISPMLKEADPLLGVDPAQAPLDRASQRIVKSTPSMISGHLVMLMFTVGMLMLGLNLAYHHYQLRQHGQLTQGIVISKGKHHQISYEFIDSKGQKVRSFNSAAEEFCDQSYIGKSISITYLTSNPSVSEITHETSNSWIAYLMVGMLSFLLIF